MLSALIPYGLGYPAVPLAGQLARHLSARPGPLVLGAALRKPPAPTTDRNQPDSHRFWPSSRAALMGEQPNPWDLLQPQDATSRNRGTKPRRLMWSLGRDRPLVPGVTFIRCTHGPPTWYRGVAKPDFRLCSACVPHSQASLCLCTRRTISLRAEETFGLLRCSLGGGRTSQTAHLALSATPYF